jgi:hypothetical protein
VTKQSSNNVKLNSVHKNLELSQLYLSWKIAK